MEYVFGKIVEILDKTKDPLLIVSIGSLFVITCLMRLIFRKEGVHEKLVEQVSNLNVLVQNAVSLVNLLHIKNKD